MMTLARSLTPDLTMDTELSPAEAVDWMFELRGGDLDQAEIPVDYLTTPAGQSVLVPTADVAELVRALLTRRDSTQYRFGAPGRRG
jgi:hypothetical protein